MNRDCAWYIHSRLVMQWSAFTISKTNLETVGKGQHLNWRKRETGLFRGWEGHQVFELICFIPRYTGTVWGEGPEFEGLLPLNLNLSLVYQPLYLIQFVLLLLVSVEGSFLTSSLNLLPAWIHCRLFISSYPKRFSLFLIFHKCKRMTLLFVKYNGNLVFSNLHILQRYFIC